MSDALVRVVAAVALLAFLALGVLVLWETTHDVVWPVARAGLLWPFVPRFGAGFVWLIAIPGLVILRHPEFERTSLRVQLGVGGLACLVVLSPLLLRVANGALDTSPPEVHRVEVVDLTPRCWPVRRNRLWVDDWWDEGTLGFSVSPAAYAACHLGDTLEVTSHAGYLGFEWAESISACSPGERR